MTNQPILKMNQIYGLNPKITPGARVHKVSDQWWRLEIPSGTDSRYRLSQLDDYGNFARKVFPWTTPVSITLHARASHEDIPGTWGFGLWNDPFSLSLGMGGGVRRFPALPNAAWFFFASDPNYLSLRDDIPASGNIAATFQSRAINPAFLALGALITPLLLMPPLGRWVRRVGRRLIKQDAVKLAIETCEWHQFEIDWKSESSTFRVDHQVVLQTSTSPIDPLGLVIWIDNQYAALPPDGRLRYGTLANNEPAWIEINHLIITQE